MDGEEKDEVGQDTDPRKLSKGSHDSHRLRMGKGLPGSWLVGSEGLQDSLGWGRAVGCISSHLAGPLRVSLSWHKQNQEPSPEKVALIPKMFFNFYFVFIFLKFSYESKRILF